MKKSQIISILRPIANQHIQRRCVNVPADLDRAIIQRAVQLGKHMGRSVAYGDVVREWLKIGSSLAQKRGSTRR